MTKLIWFMLSFGPRRTNKQQARVESQWAVNHISQLVVPADGWCNVASIEQAATQAGYKAAVALLGHLSSHLGLVGLCLKKKRQGMTNDKEDEHKSHGVFALLLPFSLEWKKQKSLAGLQQVTVQFIIGTLTPESIRHHQAQCLLLKRTLHIFVYICLFKEGKDHVGGLKSCIILTRSFNSLLLIFPKFQNNYPLSNYFNFYAAHN